jgi:REP element-mobilizing transposase RayT
MISESSYILHYVIYFIHMHLLFTTKYIEEKLWSNSLWSPSYFAGSCDGASLEVIKKYIEK